MGSLLAQFEDRLVDLAAVLFGHCLDAAENNHRFGPDLGRVGAMLAPADQGTAQAEGVQHLRSSRQKGADPHEKHPIMAAAPRQ